MDSIKSITIDELKKFCEEYDNLYESWPEHKYEGSAVLEFILKKLEVELENNNE